MNLHGWLLNEDGAHLAASKRVIRMSSSSSSPVIDLGDHLLRIRGFILYDGFLKVSTSGVNTIGILYPFYSYIFILITVLSSCRRIKLYVMVVHLTEI